MKMIKNYMTYLVVLTLLLTSCSKEEGTNLNDPSSETAVLSFGAVLNDITRQAMTKAHFNQVPDCVDGATPEVARITVSYGDITKTIDVDILFDGESYYTDYTGELEIPVEVSDDEDDTNDFTTVTLEEFMIYDGDPDDDGEMIWIAPKSVEGASFAGYVDNPLPFDITLRPGVKKYVDVDVLCFDRRMVNQYGYLFFDIQNKELIQLCLFGNVCTPDGRHYVANYSVDAYLLNDDGSLGEQLYDDLESISEPNVDGDYAASPLCLVLPDDPNEEDTYYIEVTLLDGEDYDSNYEGEIVKTLTINDVGVKTFYTGETNQDYAHFFVNCDEEDMFEEPGDDVMNYKACLKPLNNSGVVAITAVKLQGHQLTVLIAATAMVPNQMHPQHIHGIDGENATCPPASAAGPDGIISIPDGLPFYGDIQLPLQNADMEFPTSDAAGNLTYNYTFTLSNEQLASITPLEDKVIVLHGLMVDGQYMATIPVACNELQEVGMINQ